MENKYPNRLEKILGITFLGGLLLTGIYLSGDAIKSKISSQTCKTALLTLVAGYGAFRREDEFDYHSQR